MNEDNNFDYENNSANSQPTMSDEPEQEQQVSYTEPTTQAEPEQPKQENYSQPFNSYNYQDNVQPKTEQSDFSKYNDYTEKTEQPEEPAYSPYSSQQYSQYTQPDYSQQFDAKPEKKNNKGFKALIIAIIAVVLCVAIVLAVYPKISKKSSTTENSNGDSTTITLNESPASSSTESLTAEKIAAQAKKFNVGILLYATTNNLMSSYSSSSSSSSLAGEGSGIIMSEDSTGKYTYILTCAHVISDVDSKNYTITVQDYNSKTYDATIVGYDEKTDIGVLKIQATGLTCAEFGDSSKLEIGQTVYAIGNPGGTEFFGSFTNGIVSAIDRPISSESGYEMNCIQHTTPINSGNSGGALMNEYGQVIGINSSKIVSTGYEGMAFSIPITEAKTIIDDIIANGYVTNRAKLGIKYAAASQYQQYALIVKLKDLPAGSLVIAKITSDSSLADTDAQVGDLITAVNGEELTTADVLLDKIENGSVGDELELTLCRISNDYSIKEFKVNVKLVADTGTSSDDEEQTTTQNYWEQYFGQGY